MRILVDENLPRSLAPRLRRAGHDAVDLRELGKTGISDPDILALANADQRVVVSANYKHFANILLYPPAKSHGILVVRMPKCTMQALMARIEDALANAPEAAFQACLTIVEPGRIRRRR
jgi:predicted nuclease of predicted toxin-antitoxin system